MSLSGCGAATCHMTQYVVTSDMHKCVQGRVARTMIDMDRSH